MFNALLVLSSLNSKWKSSFQSSISDYLAENPLWCYKKAQKRVIIQTFTGQTVNMTIIKIPRLSGFLGWDHLGSTAFRVCSFKLRSGETGVLRLFVIYSNLCRAVSAVWQSAVCCFGKLLSSGSAITTNESAWSAITFRKLIGFIWT